MKILDWGGVNGWKEKKKTHTTERIDRRPLAGWRGGEIGGGSAPAEITGANKRYTRPKTIKGNQDRVGWQWRHIQSTNQLPTPRYKSSIPPLLTAIDGRYFYIVWSFNSLFFLPVSSNRIKLKTSFYLPIDFHLFKFFLFLCFYAWIPFFIFLP